ncbi:hypothetical protein EDD86DRAFT_174549, partial [Gorgonomyces haynaldii]
VWWKVGCLLGGSSVVLGAFGAHGLKSRLSQDPESERKLQNWTTASHYMMLHSVVLLIASQRNNTLASALLTLGILGFSGSIYGLVLVKDPKVKKILGPITPLGGLCFIGGWMALAF